MVWYENVPPLSTVMLATSITTERDKDSSSGNCVDVRVLAADAP